MEVDYLIIGQGICGTFLSFYLQREGKTVLVIDQQDSSSPSNIAAGVINPVTGRRLVTVWRVEEILPFARQAYGEMGDQLGIDALSEKTVIDFFPNPFMREGFLDKIRTGDSYVHAFPDQNQFNEQFNYEFGVGEIKPAYTAHLETLLPSWRNSLNLSGALREERFEPAELELNGDHVRYRDVTASKILFCDGVASFSNPLFNALPYAPNKGEALVIEARDIPVQHVYKKGMMLVPMVDQDRFWIGSSYEWEFDHTDPTEKFRTQTETLLKNWLRMPFKTLEHRAGLRPATLERRPFVGLHPLHPQVGILNGMGTKGCSLAPFFAWQLTGHLLNDTAIAPDADLKRFTRVLSK